MLQLLQQVPIERVALLLFTAGQIYGQFKSARRSLREHGQRLGKLESDVAELKGLLSAARAQPPTAPEASGTRGG